jgi:putative intracellular protease/amidase
MILMPLPDYDFDPTEASIPWKILAENNIGIMFATPSGKAGKADGRLLTGKGLGIWARTLMARKDAVRAYETLQKDSNYLHPLKYGKLNPSDYDGIILPGGHAPGMKSYLESNILQEVIIDFFNRNKPAGAICHGVLLAARSINPKTGKSVLYEKKTTALLKSQELTAFYMTFLWLGRYYRTYNMTVEDEVTSYLKTKDNFIQGPAALARDSKRNLEAGFAVRDGNYVSARWPGDAYNFSFQFLKMLRNEA